MNNKDSGSSFIAHRSPFEFRLPRNRSLAIPHPPAVMGVLNVTPDSFSDGGLHFDRARAVDAANTAVASHGRSADARGLRGGSSASAECSLATAVTVTSASAERIVLEDDRLYPI